MIFKFKYIISALLYAAEVKYKNFIDTSDPKFRLNISSRYLIVIFMLRLCDEEMALAK